MKSTVDAKAFATALKKVSAALRPSSIPVLDQVLVEFSEGTCRLTASDLNVWFSDEIPAEGDAFSLVFSNTKAIARASSHFNGRLTLELTGEDRKLTLRCGGKSGEFPTLDPQLYPERPDFEPEYRYPIKVYDLYERVKGVSYASCVSEQHPIAAGVRFQDNRVWCVDNNRMAIHRDSSLEVEQPFILRAAHLELLREFDKRRGEMAVGADYVSVKSRGMLLLMRRMTESDSVTIERTVPKEFNEAYYVDRKQYLDALNYLRDCGGSGVNAKAVFDGGLLLTDGKNGRYSVKVDTGKPRQVCYAFRLAHMREAMKQFDGSRQVKISVVNASTPIVISDGAGNMALLLTLPLETKEDKKAA